MNKLHDVYLIQPGGTYAINKQLDLMEFILA